MLSHNEEVTSFSLHFVSPGHLLGWKHWDWNRIREKFKTLRSGFERPEEQKVYSTQDMVHQPGMAGTGEEGLFSGLFFLLIATIQGK